MMRYYWAWVNDDHQPVERTKLFSTLSQDYYTTLVQVGQSIPSVYSQVDGATWWPQELSPYDLSSVSEEPFTGPAEWLPLVDERGRHIAILVRSYL